MFLCLILLLMVRILDANPGNCGNITIKEDGKDVQRFAITGNPEWCWTNDSSSITLLHNAQVQIAKRAIQPSPNNTYYPDMYVEYKLNGKTVSYTVDLSEISCSCNANLFFNSMPGYYANGQPDPGQHGHYYCDANDGSEPCWEMDLFEGNKYCSQITPHNCSGPPGQHIESCDHGGCNTNTYRINSSGICPDSKCRINTMKAYRQSVYFGNDTLHTTFSQNGNTFEFDVCGKPDYIYEMNTAYDYGMVMIISYWGSNYDNMKWLDGMTGCTGDCDTNGKYIVSDIEIK